MRITYTTSENDFARAGALLVRTSSIRFAPWMGGSILFLVAVEIVTSASTRAALATPASIPKLAFGLGCPALMSALPWLTRRNLRKQYRMNPVIGETRTLQADFSGIHLRSESASADIGWNTYSAFAEDRYTFALVQKGSPICVPIPKRELSAEEIDEVRSVFETYLPRK